MRLETSGIVLFNVGKGNTKPDNLEKLWRWVDRLQESKMVEEAEAGSDEALAARCSGYLEALEDFLGMIEHLHNSK